MKIDFVMIKNWSLLLLTSLAAGPAYEPEENKSVMAKADSSGSFKAIQRQLYYRFYF